MKPLPSVHSEMEQLSDQASTAHTEKEGENLSDHNLQHKDILARILFIYAKLNPGLRFIHDSNDHLTISTILYYIRRYFWFK